MPRNNGSASHRAAINRAKCVTERSIAAPLETVSKKSGQSSWQRNAERANETRPGGKLDGAQETREASRRKEMEPPRPMHRVALSVLEAMSSRNLTKYSYVQGKRGEDARSDDMMTPTSAYVCDR